MYRAPHYALSCIKTTPASCSVRLSWSRGCCHTVMQLSGEEMSMSSRQEGFQSPNGEKPETETQMQDKLKLPPEQQQHESVEHPDRQQDQKKKPSQP